MKSVYLPYLIQCLDIFGSLRYEASLLKWRDPVPTPGLAKDPLSQVRGMTGFSPSAWRSFSFARLSGFRCRQSAQQPSTKVTLPTDASYLYRIPPRIASIAFSLEQKALRCSPTAAETVLVATINIEAISACRSSLPGSQLAGRSISKVRLISDAGRCRTSTSKHYNAQIDMCK